MAALNVFAAKPWLALYGTRPQEVRAGFQDMLSLFRAAALDVPEQDCIRYFGTILSYRTLDQQSDALAVWLAAEAHVTQGARVAIILQNVPEFVIGTLAVWKLGAAPMPINPTYRERELARLFGDGSPAAVICEAEAGATVRAALELAGKGQVRILTAAAGDMRDSHEAGARHEAGGGRQADLGHDVSVGRGSLHAAIAARFGQHPPTFIPAPENMGLLLYTSGTTGDPKGAVLSHRALAFNSEISVDWFGMSQNARVLAIAPLFHITGFQVEMCAGWLARGVLLLNYRFDPKLVLDSMLTNRPTFTICAITAYIALMSCPEAGADHFSSFHTLYCGGAPIPPSVLERFEQRFGRRISSAYGMTESCAPTHVCPEEIRVPVDAALGCTSIGIPVSNVDILIRRGDGSPANTGEAGELLIRGPMLMDSYFNNPQVSAETLRDGWLHTGDIACMDAQGWFFLVDRKKDVIICSGFKVWPREVEDVIYGHPSVREAAVVGVPDSYRGETIKAYVSLRPGTALAIDELLQLCRANLAGYKVPRLVEILPDLPKTATGKIMRVELRKRAARG